jgi:NAD-dependent SIR2 family protein deacetylase
MIMYPGLSGKSHCDNCNKETEHTWFFDEWDNEIVECGECGNKEMRD